MRFEIIGTAVCNLRNGNARGVTRDDTPWFTANCRLAFDRKQTAYRAWTRRRTDNLWREYQQARRDTQSVYSEAKELYFARARQKLNAESSAHGWWETLKSSLFGASPSLPSLIGPGGRLVSAPEDKAELLSYS